MMMMNDDDDDDDGCDPDDVDADSDDNADNDDDDGNVDDDDDDDDKLLIAYYHVISIILFIDKEYDDMVLSGYQAFMDWNGILNKKVGLRQPNYSALYVLWILKVLEFILYLFIDTYYIIYNMITNFCCWCYSVFQRSYHHHHQHQHDNVAAVTAINRKHKVKLT
jgi:hypothetical protein